MNLTPDHIIYRSESHPHPPVQVIQFLKNDLKVSRKYVTMVVGQGAEHLSRMWAKQVHLLCVVEPQTDYFFYLKTILSQEESIWIENAPLTELPLDADSIDCAIVLGEGFEAIQKELNRTLRLNSYVVKINHILSSETERTFSWAYSHFFKQYASIKQHEYEDVPMEENLQLFFKNNYEHRAFSNQVRLSWDGIQAYYLSSKGALTVEDAKYKWALKALRILFDQYQIEGEVLLDYQTQLYYGLYNKNVPAISLRKNVFFNLLRPFAFGFYVLVKMNIYFWKNLYKLRERMRR